MFFVNMISRQYRRNYKIKEVGIMEQQITAIANTVFEMNNNIRELQEAKFALESKLIYLLDHRKEEGQESHKIGEYKITVKTGFNHKLDIKKYQEVAHLLPNKFDPVKTSVKYELNERDYRNIKEYATNETLLTISEFLTSTPSKPYVTIKMLESNDE